MEPKLKPGDKYTLKDGRVVEVVMSPFVLLGLENKGCKVCCLKTGGESCLATRLIATSCLLLIGDNYFKWSEDDAEQSEDDNSREDKVSSE